ncbi:Holliday junction branch migration protein RuvA [Candidatus Sneabacter namystus]|uniref:Holliday junction branch migration complex subunit RuvA n=1 Tax=Candidatus Sneabacter namystus TaxID=2601646 RepID=A0A5C0UIJ5_9RICK|nr:Holliday junction branch migration protein RuvA [Candidatus Sneabacter namystus]QEK39333.1 Holliday junction branch migration protein RuvA [Candidatus Sneabacter namystus]
MIAKIVGILEDLEEEFATVMTNSGVGYLIHCTKAALMNTTIGESISLLINTHYKEQKGIQLFGFASKTEKNFFNMLQSVSGVGSKMAMAIISHLSAQGIINSVHTKNALEFSAVPGVGKKLSERIVLELQSKISKIALYSETTNNQYTEPSIRRDAILALTQLGLNQLDAATRVNKVLEENAAHTKEDEEGNLSVTSLIKKALQQ